MLRFVNSRSELVPISTLALLLSLSGCEANVPPKADVESKATQSTTAAAPVTQPESPERVTFQDLDCSIQSDIVFREWMLSERARELTDQRIRISGYILPDIKLRGITEFILQKNTECKFGPGGQADHIISVKLNEGVTTSYTNEPIDVVGILRFKPVTGLDGNTWGIYELETESVGPMRR